MRLRTRLILALSFLAVSLADLLGWGSPWMGVLAYGVGVSAILIQLSERRIRGADEHATLNLHR